MSMGYIFFPKFLKLSYLKRLLKILIDISNNIKTKINTYINHVEYNDTIIKTKTTKTTTIVI